MDTPEFIKRLNGDEHAAGMVRTVVIWGFIAVVALFLTQPAGEPESVFDGPIPLPAELEQLQASMSVLLLTRHPRAGGDPSSVRLVETPANFGTRLRGGVITASGRDDGFEQTEESIALND